MYHNKGPLSKTGPSTVYSIVQCRPVGSNYRLGGGAHIHKKQLQIGGGGGGGHT